MTTASLTSQMYQIANNTAKYEGGWNNARGRQGQGRQLFENGDSYEGEFADNVFSGEGVYRFADGSEYKGSFANGLFDGPGELKLVRETGVDVYTGTFKAGQREGKFVVHYASGATFEGSFHKDRKFEGVLKKGNMEFKGRFANNRFEGRGEYTCPEFSFKGTFKAHMRAGKGVEKAKEFTYKGMFEENTASGKGSYECEKGKLRCAWVAGVAQE